MEEKNIHRDVSVINEEDFEQLYKQYFQRLYNFSIQFTKDESLSHDMVHEVFLKLWKARKSIKDDSLGALLFRMTRNMCLNHIKHLKVVENITIDLRQARQWEELYRVEFVRDEPYLLIEKELKENINSIMKELPDRCREVFKLSREEGLKNREIAHELNISLKTVEKHISNAMRIFKKELPILLSSQLITLVLAHSL